MCPLTVSTETKQASATPFPAFYFYPCDLIALFGSSDGKEPTCNAGDLGSIPGWGRSAGEGYGTHSSLLAWSIPWTEKPGGLQRVGYKWVTHTFTFSMAWIHGPTTNRDKHSLIHRLHAYSNNPILALRQNQTFYYMTSLKKTEDQVFSNQSLYFCSISPNLKWVHNLKHYKSTYQYVTTSLTWYFH